MYIYIHTRVNPSMCWGCIYIFIHAQLYIYIYIYVHAACVHPSIHIHACIHPYIHPSTCNMLQLHECMSEYTCINWSRHACIHPHPHHPPPPFRSHSGSSCEELVAPRPQRVEPQPLCRRIATAAAAAERVVAVVATLQLHQLWPWTGWTRCVPSSTGCVPSSTGTCSWRRLRVAAHQGSSKPTGTCPGAWHSWSITAAAPPRVQAPAPERHHGFKHQHRQRQPTALSSTSTASSRSGSRPTSRWPRASCTVRAKGCRRHVRPAPAPAWRSSRPAR